LRISFNLIQFILFTLVELSLLVFLVSVPICSDTAGYLSHSGFAISQTLVDAVPYGTLYLFREGGYTNYDWFKFIQFISIVIFNISIFILPCVTKVKSFFYLSPFIFSIVGLHYWSCGIRNGLAISFVALLYSLMLSLRSTNTKINTYLSIGLIFIAALAQLSHWSAFINIIFCSFLMLADFKFSTIIKYLLAFKFNRKAALLCSIGMLVLAGFASLYIQRVNLYLLFESNNVEYNRYLPYVTLASLLALSALSATRKLGNIRLDDFACIFLATIGIALLSFIFQGIFMARILSPLLLFIILILANKLKTISSALTLFLFLSPPYIYYTLITYSKSYFP